jgi:hypothetical protein
MNTAELDDRSQIAAVRLRLYSGGLVLRPNRLGAGGD